MRDKFKTLLYLFSVTILPQFMIVFLIGSWLLWGIFGLIYPSLVIMMAIIGFVPIVLIIANMAVVVYAARVPWIPPRKDKFDSDLFKGHSYTVTDVKISRPDSFGRRTVHTRERQVGGNVLFFLWVFLYTVIILLLGTLKFIPEAILILVSEKRRLAWEDSKRYVAGGISANAQKTFLIGGIMMIVLWIVACPLMIRDNYAYAPERFVFTVTEKAYGTYQDSGEIPAVEKKLMTLTCGVRNTSPIDISALYGTIYIENDNGDCLYEIDLNIYEDKRIPKDEVYFFEIPISEKVYTQWESDVDDLNIYAVLNKVCYDNGVFMGQNMIEFANRPHTLRFTFDLTDNAS